MAELGASMTSSELSEWAAYEVFAGPLGSARYDWLAARLTHASLRAVAMRAGVPFDVNVSDFLVFSKPPPKPDQSDDELLHVLRTIGRAIGKPREKPKG